MASSSSFYPDPEQLEALDTSNSSAGYSSHNDSQQWTTPASLINYTRNAEQGSNTAAGGSLNQMVHDNATLGTTKTPKPYICVEGCTNKRFGKMYGLMRHSRMQHQCLAFKCKGVRFATRIERETHLRQHMTRYWFGYRCGSCLFRSNLPKSTTRVHKSNMHFRVAHKITTSFYFGEFGYVPGNCSIDREYCGIYFASQQELEEHYGKKHKKATDSPQMHTQAAMSNLDRLFSATPQYTEPVVERRAGLNVAKHPLNPTSIATDCGWEFGHREYNELQQNLLIVTCSLGHGSIGVVDEVRVSTELPSFVRKRISLPYSQRNQHLRIIKQEAEALELLVHPHIVKIIGSYREGSSNGKQFYSLLMFPVGEQDLKNFLQMVGDPSWAGHHDGNKKEKTWLQKWFKCLASALSYMHSQGIRHQDIKPSNIIHRGDDVFFTDFSSASQFQVGQTTSTENPARTSAMYSAPEVINNRGDTLHKHGRGTDVFALGMVFCEMLTVVDGRSLDEFHQFCLHTESGAETANKVLLYGRCTQRANDWFGTHDFYDTCIRPMLAFDREDRPCASMVEERIRNFSEWERIPCSCDTEYV
jgi:hypothetical protein